MGVISNVSVDTVKQAEGVLQFLVNAIENPKALKTILGEISTAVKLSDDLLAQKAEAEKTIQAAIVASNELASEQKEFEEYKDSVVKDLTQARKIIDADAEKIAGFKAKVEAELAVAQTKAAETKAANAAETKRLTSMAAALNTAEEELNAKVKTHEAQVAKFEAQVAKISDSLDARDKDITAREEVFRNVAKQLG